MQNRNAIVRKTFVVGFVLTGMMEYGLAQDVVNGSKPRARVYTPAIQLQAAKSQEHVDMSNIEQAVSAMIGAGISNDEAWSLSIMSDTLRKQKAGRSAEEKAKAKFNFDQLFLGKLFFITYMVQSGDYVIVRLENREPADGTVVLKNLYAFKRFKGKYYVTNLADSPHGIALQADFDAALKNMVVEKVSRKSTQL